MINKSVSKKLSIVLTIIMIMSLLLPVLPAAAATKTPYVSKVVLEFDAEKNTLTAVPTIKYGTEDDEVLYKFSVKDSKKKYVIKDSEYGDSDTLDVSELGKGKFTALVSAKLGKKSKSSSWKKFEIINDAPVQEDVVVTANPVVVSDLEVGKTAKVALTAKKGEAAVEGITFTAQSNNAAVATAAVAGNEVTVTGVAAGAATITVNGTKTGETVKSVSIPVEVKAPEVLAIDSVTAVTKTKIQAVFNKALDAVAADNFKIEGGTVTNATFADSTKKVVELTVTGLNFDTDYTLVASNLVVEGNITPTLSKSFKTVAVTDVYQLTLETNATNDTIKADGADSCVITAKLVDKVTGAVDTNANDIVIAFSATYGDLANSRVTVQNGIATVLFRSESLQKVTSSKIDAQIIEASVDYQALIGKVSATHNVIMDPIQGGGTVETKPVLVKAESNVCGSVTLYFNKDITTADFYTLQNNVLVPTTGTSVTVSQDNFATNKAIVGYKTVPGNSQAMEVILATPGSALQDNKEVQVKATIGNFIEGTANFVVTDARKPEPTAVAVDGLNTIKVTFSEPIAQPAASQVLVDAGLYSINAPVVGTFNPVTGEDTRNILTITIQNYNNSNPVNPYMAAGNHSIQLSAISDWAGLSDTKNISTTQSLDFTVAADDSVPTATVTVESPEQYRVKFNKIVTGFERADITLKKYNATTSQYEAVATTDQDLVITQVSGSEYTVEVTRDWTLVYDTQNSKKNYFNDKFQLFIAKDGVANPANGKKNADMALDLSYAGSALTFNDVTSPSIAVAPAQVAGTGNLLVTMSEPVKITGLDIADTPSQFQGVSIPNTIVEFQGKDDKGAAVIIQGTGLLYADLDIADKMFIVTPVQNLQNLVDNSKYDKNWTLIVRSISDDVGNTATTLTKDFVITPSTQAAEVFRVVGSELGKVNVAAGGPVTGIVGDLANATKDQIYVTFTSNVKYTGNVENATNVANYLLDGETLPKGTSISILHPDANGLTKEILIILPDNTLSAAGTNVLLVSKYLKSATGVQYDANANNEFVFSADPDMGSVLTDANALVVPATVNAAFNLPVAGANGTTITWLSNNPAIIIDAAGVATVTPQADDVTVNLIATITKNAATTTKTFTVLVPKATLPTVRTVAELAAITDTNAANYVPVVVKGINQAVYLGTNGLAASKLINGNLTDDITFMAGAVDLRNGANVVSTATGATVDVSVRKGATVLGTIKVYLGAGADQTALTAGEQISLVPINF